MDETSTVIIVAKSWGAFYCCATEEINSTTDAERRNTAIDAAYRLVQYYTRRWKLLGLPGTKNSPPIFYVVQGQYTADKYMAPIEGAPNNRAQFKRWAQAQGWQEIDHHTFQFVN